jgi:hypothetical protein
MSSTIFNNHPLIDNANQYFYEKKYISIHSEDRDLEKYPNSASFEIELPQDYLNVASARLYSWSFPANYNVFSVFNYNVAMTFKLSNLYNPGAHDTSDVLLEGIFAALYSNLDLEYVVIIETGFYNPAQMSVELSNKFNEAVTNTINLFFESHPEYAEAQKQFVTYNRFKIVYNSVSQKLWFGNSADQFILTNDSEFYLKKTYVDASCTRKNLLPQFSDWGLPAYLGFTRCPVTAIDANEVAAQFQNTYAGGSNTSVVNQKIPRFYYGDVGDGDNGYWLLPSEPGSTVYFIEPPFKISFMGPAYFYMDIGGLNCIDETSPWNLSNFTAHTNLTNGIVNSSFAKLAIPTTPLSQWFDEDTAPYKYFNPPAERIRKLNIRLRYHNGQNVDFGQFEYSFMLEFNLLTPQQQRKYSIRDSFSLSQTQSF